MLELPEGRDLTVIQGYSEMVKNRTSQKSTPDDDSKSAAKEYFDSVKLSKDDNFEPATTDKSSVTEKNEATTATALAVAQDITPKKMRKSTGMKKKKGKNIHFKIVNKSKNKKK